MNAKNKLFLIGNNNNPLLMTKNYFLVLSLLMLFISLFHDGVDAGTLDPKNNSWGQQSFNKSKKQQLTTMNKIHQNSSNIENRIPQLSPPQNNSISTSFPSQNTRTRPAFEKLVIGPLMVLCEKVTGGHYLEVLRLGKQMMSTTTSLSYHDLHKSFISETGFLGAFYRGFWPWSALECFKGIPVLFVQNEARYQMETKFGFSPDAAERFSGFLGGASQAIFVCPLQKIKVAVVASPVYNNLSPFQCFKKVVEVRGFRSLYDGFYPTMFRRSIDWGIRFTVVNEMKHHILEQRKKKYSSDAGNFDDNELKLHELVLCGFVGGAVSALTHPIDNIITNSQKPMMPGVPTDFISVARRMCEEGGTQAFTRGFAVKVFDNAYHTAWMYGVGTILYDRWRRK